MAIENKWKASTDAQVQDSSPAIDSLLEEETSIGVRSDWTMQRKMGVAMGIVGAILVVVGVAPMVLESDDLKGSLAESTQEVDPLLTLLGGDNSSQNSSASIPEDTQFAAAIPTGTTGFGEVDTLDVEESSAAEMVTMPDTSVETATATSSEISPESTPTPASAVVVTPENSLVTDSTSIDSEVDRILAKETAEASAQNPENSLAADETSAPLANANTGSTDTLGSEFMTENPNTPVVMADEENLHGSAGLQNTTTASAATQLTNSGPADSALILFLLSLFAVGGMRYRKLLF